MTAALSAVVVWGAAHRLGPLAWMEPSVHLLVVQLFLIVLAATGLVLAAAVAEGREAERRLRDTTPAARGHRGHARRGLREGQGRALPVHQQAGARYMERRVEEVIGRTDAELFERDILRQIQTYDRLVLESGEVRTDEYNEIRDGMRRAFLATKGPVRDAQGEITGIFGISREITNRKLERMLLNGILEGTHDLVSAVDLDFRFVAFNQALSDEYRRGSAWSSSQGARIADVLAEHPEALAQRLAAAGTRLPGRRGAHDLDHGPLPPRGKWVRRAGEPAARRDGPRDRGRPHRPRHHQGAGGRDRAQGQPVALPRPEPPGPGGHLRDRPLGPLHLRERGLVRADRRRRGAGAGRGLEPGRPPDDLARVGFAWDETVERGRTFRLEYRFFRERRPGALGHGRGGAPAGRARLRAGLPGHGGGRQRARQAEEDLRRTTEALAAANQELESFSYSVSHDLRAPLRGIDGFSRALEEDYGEGLTGRRAASSAASGTPPAAWARSSTTCCCSPGWRAASCGARRVDLGALALEVYAALRAAEPGRDVRLAVGEGLRAGADGRLLRLVLENLLGNAWKYTSRRPRAFVEFAAARAAGRRSTIVRDDGAGFDMAYADKLFGAFSRLHSASEFPGSGIGLATVARIVHRHGGGCGRRGAGQGRDLLLHPGAGRSRLNEPTILLVEDNPDDVELTLRALRKNEVRCLVDVAADGAAALDYLVGPGRAPPRLRAPGPEAAPGLRPRGAGAHPARAAHAPAPRGRAHLVGRAGGPRAVLRARGQQLRAQARGLRRLHAGRGEDRDLLAEAERDPASRGAA